MAVLLPPGGAEVDLDVTTREHAVECEECAPVVRAGAAIAAPGIDDLNRPAVHGR